MLQVINFRRACVCSAATALFFTVGCASTFHEHHFFKSTDGDGSTVNYYRVTVDGNTILSSSRYISGYYDPIILDNYFNTFAQPEKGQLPFPAAEKGKADNSPSSTSSGSEAPPATLPAGAKIPDVAPPPADTAPGAPVAKNTPSLNIKPLETASESRKLVLLLSSNSDRIAQDLSAMTKSSQVAATLSNIMGKPHFEAANASASRAALGSERGKVVAAHASTVIAGTPSNDDLLRLADQLANLISPSQPHATFKDFDAAQNWLLEHAGKENQ